MEWKTAAATLMALGICGESYAADKNGEYTVLSFGTRSCAQVIADFDGDGNRRLANSTWVGGYLTAVNKLAFKGKDISAGTDADGRMLWIVNFCKASPLETLEGATTALVAELRKRAR
jgi:hypothetical protein